MAIRKQLVCAKGSFENHVQWEGGISTRVANSKYKGSEWERKQKNK